MSIKDTLTNNSMDSFSFGGKTYARRVDNGAVVYDISAGTDGSAFSTGWVNTDGTTTVADGATLTFNHNLGTTDFVIQIWVSHDAAGSNAYQIFTDSASSTAGSKMDGAIIDNISENQLTLQLGAGGFFNVSSSGTWSKESWASKYVKVVVSAKMGSGGGGGTPAGSDRELQFNDNGTFGANANLRFDGSTTFLPRLAVGEGNASGDEGGELSLRQSETNNTLVGNWVYMDSYRNLIRFFEDGPPYKGAYIDLSECADGVGTNLLAGGSGGGSGGGYIDGASLNTATAQTHQFPDFDPNTQSVFYFANGANGLSYYGVVQETVTNIAFNSSNRSASIYINSTGLVTSSDNYGGTGNNADIQLFRWSKGSASGSGGGSSGGGYIDMLSVATNNQPVTFPDFDENTQVILAQLYGSSSSGSALEELPVGTNSLALYFARLSLTSGGVVTAYDTASGNTTYTLKLYRFARSSASSGGGGASVTTDETVPTNPSDGDLWYDENSAALYVYTDSIGGWIQANGGGGSGNGPRAYISFDSSVAGGDIKNSFNVSSITDISYSQFDVNFASPVPNPVITVGAHNLTNQLGLAAFHLVSSDKFRAVGHGITAGSAEPTLLCFTVH